MAESKEELTSLLMTVKEESEKAGLKTEFVASAPIISWLQSPSTVILEPKKRKSVTLSTFPPSTCHGEMRLDAKILVS